MSDLGYKEQKEMFLVVSRLDEPIFCVPDRSESVHAVWISFEVIQNTLVEISTPNSFDAKTKPKPSISSENLY